MNIIKCPVCGKEFEKHSRQIYCSVKCRTKATLERRKKSETFFCIECGEETKKTGRNQIWCPECSENLRRKNAAKRQQFNYNNARRDLRHAEKGMSGIETGNLDKWKKEADRRGISYGELKKEIAIQKAGKIKI